MNFYLKGSGKCGIIKYGSSLICMGKPIHNMLEIRHQEMEEVETDHYER